MKYFFVIVFICSAASRPADDGWKPTLDAAVIQQNHQDCVEESGLQFTIRERDVTHSADRKVMDYVLCTVKKMGIFSEERGFDVDRVLMLIDGAISDKAKGRTIVRNCSDSNEEKSSPAEWAARGISCVIKAKLE